MLGRFTRGIQRGQSEAELREPDASAAVSAGERVETILQAAERAAADIRRDAEVWARQHMEETRRRADELATARIHQVSAIIDDLLVRAQTVAREVEAMEQAPRPELGPGEAAGGASYGARMLATQLAIAGSSRDQIATRLKEEFDVEDPEAILDRAGL
jgi:hypothetical protein